LLPSTGEVTPLLACSNGRGVLHLLVVVVHGWMWSKDAVNEHGP
jgi:hypothetical protein